MRPLALQKGLGLRVRSFSGCLWTDRLMLHRILANLVANAVRYTHQGGILVAVRHRPDGRICFEVWDTGVGISAEEQQRIFSDFYKVQTAGTQEGFGLGLAIVSRLADRLGCSVTVRSRLGRGTVFSVTLPPSAVIKPPEDRSPARNEWSASGS